MTLRQALLFLLVSLAVSLGVYRNAMWGAKLLAPLDLGPDIFQHYAFMDAQADGIPDNHYIIDQFTYDLPLQYAVYNAYRAGEIPWWDPYTYGGRPLLADAHINGTDPIRLLCYFTLPFELAYNWNYILRGIVTGLGMFALLRFLGIQPALAILLGLAYQFAGWFAIHFGHPWIQGAFVYYPFLWVAWSRGLTRNFGTQAAWSILLAACVFYSGNLQSHTYLALFAAAFLLAVVWKERLYFWRAVFLTSLTGIIGGLLAAPVLLNQLEFFLIGVRTPSAAGPWWQFFGSAVLSLCAFYPWMLGTFRTLDVGRVVMASGMSYFLFAGIVIYFFAAWYGWIGRKKEHSQQLARAFSLILILLFLVIVGTPLSKVFYSRCAPLAGMGIIVLAGLGLQLVTEKGFFNRRFAILATALVALCALSTSALAWFIYPKYQARIEQKVLEKDQANTSFTSAPALRKFQVTNFAREVSLRNPEAALTLLASVFLLVLLLRSGSAPVKDTALAAILALSLLPVFSFYARYRPAHDIALWQRMKEGGPAQNAAMAQTGPFRRLQESEGAQLAAYVFPNALSVLYRVHVVHGYSALQPASFHVPPKNPATFPPAWRADTHLDDPAYSAPAASVRFQSGSSMENLIPLPILQETWNSVQVAPAGEGKNLILRTDTYFPGWTARTAQGSTLSSALLAPFFSQVNLPTDSGALGPITFTYWPHYWKLALICFFAGLVVVFLLFCQPLLLSKIQNRPVL